MKNKIIMFVLFVGLLINPALCETFGDSFNHSGSASEDFIMGYNSGGSTDFYVTGIVINDIDTLANLKFLQMEALGATISQTAISGYTGVGLNIAGNPVGNGVYGWHYNPDRSKVWLTLWIQELDLTGYSGKHTLLFSGASFNIYCKYGGDLGRDTSPSTNIKHAFFTHGFSEGTSGYPDSEYFVQSSYEKIYPFNYTNDYGINHFFMERNASYQSISKISINDYLVINETSYKTYDLDYINNSYDIWELSNEDVYGNIQTKTIYYDEISTEPTLTTDKTYYNASELIEISYTNIDVIYDECISSLCNEPYQLWIYALNTPNIAKFRQWLYSDRRDETFTLNTSILTPQTEYQLMITSGENNIVISSDIFYVYPDDEYLSISCDANANCITANKAKNTFYYKINNNSNIIVKDNDNNIISTYYNIIGTGSIIYTIPDDLEHINTYPNWKVYLNNTEYSTSFNKEMVVYWSLFVTPTPTPTFTPQPTPDINISDTINEFKTETQPIKDLIFGLSEIVIDNPDYNKDNIVDEDEINHWFNSLIPICIIFLLIVLYIGLKK